MFKTLCQPVIIPATSLPPHCLHLCIQNTDSLFSPLLRTLCPCLLSLSLSLSLPPAHSHTHTILLMQSIPNAGEELLSVCACLLPKEEIHLSRDLFWSGRQRVPQRMLARCYQCNWALVIGTSGYLHWQVKRKLSAASWYVCAHMSWCNKWVFARFICCVDSAGLTLDVQYASKLDLK